MRKAITTCLIILLSLMLFSFSAQASSFGFGQSATIEPGTVFDEKGVRIDVMDLSYSGSGATLTVNINNSTNTEINVLGGAVGYSVYSINGYMVSGGYVNEDIAVDESALVTIRFDNTTLQMLGIDEIASLEFGFRIEDTNDNYLYTGPIKLYTSAHEGYDYTQNTYRDYIRSSSFERDFGVECIRFVEETIAEGSGVSITSWGVFRNASGELVLMVEAKNTSDVTANLHGTNFCVNGLKIYSGSVCFENMNPGTTAICTMNLSNMIDENLAAMFEISEIDNVAFTVQAYDDNYVEFIPAVQLLFPVNNEDSSYSANGGIELYNANGVKIIYISMYNAASEYDDDIYAMFLVENNSGIDIDLRVEDVYLNGEADSVATNFFGDVTSGISSAVELHLYSYSFEDMGIATVDDIESMSVSFKIRDTEYNTIDVFTIDVPVVNSGDGTTEANDTTVFIENTTDTSEEAETTITEESTTETVEANDDTSSEASDGTYTYLHDKWDLYKATLVSDSIVKIDCWYRFQANDETPFKLDHSVAVIKTEDASTDFTWLNESHTAFSVTIHDTENTRFEEPTLVVFELGDVVTGSLTDTSHATYTYLHDKWDLYRATRVADNLVKIDCWYRFNANEETPFKLDHCVAVIRTDDNSTDFGWVDDTCSAFYVTMQDNENSRFEEPTLVIFELEEDDID